MEGDIHEFDVSNYYGYEYDGHQDSRRVDTVDKDKPAVFPQQNALAINLFRRLQYLMKSGNQAFKSYSKFDFKVIRKYPGST